MEDQTFNNILCNLSVLPARYIIFMIPGRSGTLRLCNEIFFQAESDISGIFVNLKPTTEDQEAMNITCSHSDN